MPCRCPACVTAENPNAVQASFQGRTSQKSRTITAREAAASAHCQVVLIAQQQASLNQLKKAQVSVLAMKFFAKARGRPQDTSVSRKSDVEMHLQPHPAMAFA